jgi:two-component system sensor histidine kinase HydH
MTLIGFLYWRNAAYRKKLSAQQQLVRLGQVSRTLSHEIRNPLSAIRIQTGILKKTLPESGGEELKVIDEEVQRLALLTERVGDFLRDPLGSPEKIELAGFIRELTRRCERPIAFASQAQAGVRARVDPQRFRSVLENLIRNAIESMEGRETRRSPAPVEIFLAARKGRVEISVLDRGRGIPPELRDRIFDPFTTGKVRGSGIGLSICRRFVEAAGGRISLSDRPGGGTEARIELDQAGS